MGVARCHAHYFMSDDMFLNHDWLEQFMIHVQNPAKMPSKNALNYDSLGPITIQGIMS